MPENKNNFRTQHGFALSIDIVVVVVVDWTRMTGCMMLMLFVSWQNVALTPVYAAVVGAAVRQVDPAL